MSSATRRRSASGPVACSSASRAACSSRSSASARSISKSSCRSEIRHGLGSALRCTLPAHLQRMHQRHGRGVGADQGGGQPVGALELGVLLRRSGSAPRAGHRHAARGSISPVSGSVHSPPDCTMAVTSPRISIRSRGRPRRGCSSHSMARHSPFARSVSAAPLALIGRCDRRGEDGSAARPGRPGWRCRWPGRRRAEAFAIELDGADFDRRGAVAGARRSAG